MQFSLTVGLIGLAQYVAAAPAPVLDASSTLSNHTISTSSAVVAHTPHAVSAAETTRNVTNLGIQPALLKIPATPNSKFRKNIANAMAVAQAKYVITEEKLQNEKRQLEEPRKVQKRDPRVPLVPVTTAKGRVALVASPTPTGNSAVQVNLCAIFPFLCPSSAVKTTTSSSTAKTTSTTSSSSSIKTTTTTSTSPKRTSTSSSSTTTSKPISTTTTSSMSTSTKPVIISTSTTSSSTSTPTTSFTPTSSKPTTTSTTSTSTPSTTTTSSSASSSSSSSSSSSPTSSTTTSATRASITPATTTSSTSSTSNSASATATLSALSLSAEDIQLDSEYLSTIEIGSNNNALNMVLDTGSADLWMFSTDCVGCSSSHDFYNPEASTTFVNTTTTFSLTYGDGSTTSGLLGFDTVTVAGAPIQAQSIDVAHVISADLQGNSMDGILGLGFPSLMSVQNVAGVTTPVTSMYNQNLIPAAKFGVQLIKDTHWTYGGGGGTWTFGGADSTAISGALNTVPLSHAQYWMLPLQSVAVGSAYSGAPSIGQVIVDSGTTLILLDPTTVANIHQYLPGGRVSPDNSHYQIFCNASSAAYTGTRNAYFTLGGVQYGVPAADLAWYPEDSASEYCYSGIQGWRNSFGILGAMFLKNVYAVFDQTNQAIEFAARSDLAALTD